MFVMVVLPLTSFATNAESVPVFPHPAKHTWTNILLVENLGVIEALNPESTKVDVVKEVKVP
jgi:hypothetical protein